MNRSSKTDELPAAAPDDAKQHNAPQAPSGACSPNDVSPSAKRKTDSPIKRLLVHTSHYSLGSVLTMMAGLITFPILTRIFSVADYGVMNLVAATLTIAVALGKGGVQHSIMRYYSEISSGRGRYTLAQLTSTTLLGMLGTSLVAALTLGVATQLVPARWLGDSRIPFLLAIVSVVVVSQVPESALVNFIRAEQKTSTFIVYQVAKKYAGITLILGAVLLVSRDLTSFYVATAISEVLAFAILALIRLRGNAPSLSQFSRPLYRELLRFGVPMLVGYEISGIILMLGDRYVIEGMMGAEALGRYSAPYNLCQYVQSVFISSVGQAVMPLYMQMWDRKGREETAAFIARSLRTYVLLGGPVIAGLAAVGPALLPALASDRYASSVGILPWVIAGMVVDGANTMLGAGLFIHRKTRTVMAIVMSGATLNLVLNILLIPRIGILAAALATLISYSFTGLGLAIAGRRLLPVSVPWGTILRSAVGSTTMLLAVRSLYPGRHLATVGVRAVLGAAIYLIIMTLIDRDARIMVAKGWDRLQRWRGVRTPP